ncbi:MAG: hypothetical protein H6Q07_1638 [Acidobacteria bacterium]|jgi:hypothetical protein|nr:hypothetical protein [Acidobacteriota bacterium]
MSFLYWARYGYLFLMAFVIAAVLCVHLKNIRSR